MDQHSNQKLVYRIQGLTCTGCATKFEKSVKLIPGVIDAKVNYGASKIVVSGDPSSQQLHRAASLDGLQIFPESKLDPLRPISFWKNKKIQRVALSTSFFLIAWILHVIKPEYTALITCMYISAIIIGGAQLFQKGFRHLWRLEFDMNTLMTIAIIGAATIGQWEEGAAVVILFAISETLESFSMDKARKSIHSLMALAPKEALLLKDGNEVSTPVDDIKIGDIMIIKPGEKLAMDGVVQSGSSHINESSITGEAMPTLKNVGDEVFAGTLNTEGTLEVHVTKRIEDTTLSKIIHLVEEAQAERAPSQAFIDRFAKVYTPLILLIALITTFFPPLFLNGSWEEWFYRGLALLVVGCPCALVISTPISIVTAIGNAARNGVLVKGGVYLETAATLSTIAFDKTGTLTNGLPTVTEFISFDDSKQNTYLQIAAAIEKKSQHPIATAITRKADALMLQYDDIRADEFISFSGKGVQATIEGTTYFLGNPALLNESYPSGIPQLISKKLRHFENEGKTAIFFGSTEEVLAILAVTDEVRPNSALAIKELDSLGIVNTIMLTGDNLGTAKGVQNVVKIKEVHANLLPQEKLGIIQQAKESGLNVAMVGDGVNDAPALATASIGIAMGGAGTDTALETADIVLMGDDLRKLPFIISLSRRTLQIIKQNITFSLILKATALLLIIPGWLTLWMAVFADMGATVLVTLNSLRLTSIQKRKK